MRFIIPVSLYRVVAISLDAAQLSRGEIKGEALSALGLICLFP